MQLEWVKETFSFWNILSKALLVSFSSFSNGWRMCFKGTSSSSRGSPQEFETKPGLCLFVCFFLSSLQQDHGGKQFFTTWNFTHFFWEQKLWSWKSYENWVGWSLHLRRQIVLKLFVWNSPRDSAVRIHSLWDSHPSFWSAEKFQSESNLKCKLRIDSRTYTPKVTPPYKAALEKWWLEEDPFSKVNFWKKRAVQPREGKKAPLKIDSWEIYFSFFWGERTPIFRVFGLLFVLGSAAKRQWNCISAYGIVGGKPEIQTNYWWRNFLQPLN